MPHVSPPLEIPLLLQYLHHPTVPGVQDLVQELYHELRLLHVAEHVRHEEVILLNLEGFVEWEELLTPSNYPVYFT